MLYPITKAQNFHLLPGEEALLALDYKKISATWNNRVSHFVAFLKLAGYKVKIRVVKGKKPYFRVKGERIPVPQGEQLKLEF